MSEAAPTLEQLENESAADTMRAILAETRDSADEGAPEPLEPEHHEPEANEPRDEDRQRDEKGRFVAKEGSRDAEGAETGEDAGEREGEAAPPVAAEENEQQATSEGDEDLGPPHEWRAEEQETFRALPKEAKQFVLERARQADEVYQKAGHYVQKYYNLDQILAPRLQSWYASGTDEVGMIRQLLALSDQATAQPAEFAQLFARERGLRPEQVFPQLAKQQSGDQDYADPEIAGLRQQNQQLQERLDRIEGTYKSQEQQAYNAQYQQTLSQVQQFQSETDERGRPKHPYFNEVQGLMKHLIESAAQENRAIDLETAYDMAIHAHPDVRAKIASAQRAQQERERAAEQRKKAEAARRAGSSVSGTPGDRTRAEPSGDLREDLRSQFAERGMF